MNIKVTYMRPQTNVDIVFVTQMRYAQGPCGDGDIFNLLIYHIRSGITHVHVVLKAGWTEGALNATDTKQHTDDVM